MTPMTLPVIAGGVDRHLQGPGANVLFNHISLVCDPQVEVMVTVPAGVVDDLSWRLQCRCPPGWDLRE